MQKTLTMKKWYSSKTLWANGLAFAAIVFQLILDQEVIGAEAQVAILSLLNVILRIITKESIEW